MAVVQGHTKHTHTYRRDRSYRMESDRIRPLVAGRWCALTVVGVVVVSNRACCRLV